ncbi:MAG: protein-export chaperone SecB [Smithella sp.]|nr:protein-export chaperone SecB [Smithella sp.]
MELKFRIETIRQIEAHFALNRQYKWVKDEIIEFQQSIEIEQKSVDNILGVVVRFYSDSEKQPFRFSVAWEGAFVFEKLPAKELLERIAHINCASIIFPYVRESVADLTRRASITPLNLQPMNFVALYDEKHKSASQSATKKPVKKSKIKK